LNSVRNSSCYKDVIDELSFPFGNYYLFDGFVVAEINEGVVYSWEEHGKFVSMEIASLYNNKGGDLIYITNRIYKYAIKPTDWLKFFKEKYYIKAYAIISYSTTGCKNALIEKLFMPVKVYRFTTLESAIEWAKKEKSSQDSA
tara:strand:- start:9053 stop:9481 length:429 start_codon:yes stop_codon:yes gene_type:complete